MIVSFVDLPASLDANQMQEVTEATRVIIEVEIDLKNEADYLHILFTSLNAFGIDADSLFAVGNY